MREKLIMNFCGCDVILRANEETEELNLKFINRAEKEIKNIFEKEFRTPTDKELRKIVERELGVKKHWLFGWIKS